MPDGATKLESALELTSSAFGLAGVSGPANGAARNFGQKRGQLA
jgi:hypothetical protein